MYIEDTDAFGVVYHANYLRFFERAACDLVGTAAAGGLLGGGLSLGLRSAHGLKISRAARLGDACEVCCKPLGLDARGSLALRASLVRADGAVLSSCEDLRLGFGTLGAVEVRPFTAGQSLQLLRTAAGSSEGTIDDAACGSVATPPAAAAGPAPSAALRLEFDEAGPGGRLTLHSAARYFERHRTQILGGPDALAELQARMLGGSILIRKPAPN